LEFTFGGQGYSAGIASFQADFTPGKAAERMRHIRPPGLGIPFKYVVRAEIKALQIRAAEAGVDGGKPGEFLAKTSEQRHMVTVHESHE